MNGFWLGPLGDMRPIKCPPPGLSVTHTQPTSLVEPLDGPPVVYRSAQVNRSWPLVFGPTTSPQEVAHLIGLTRHPGPLYYVDPFIARTNLLSPERAEPGLRLDASGGVAGWRGSSGAQVIGDGGPMSGPALWPVQTWSSASLPVRDTVAAGLSTPCLPSTVYTAALLVEGVAEVRVLGHTAASGEAATQRIATALNASGHVTLSGVSAPDVAALSVFVISRSAGVRFSAVMVTEGLDRYPWHPGVGVARVALTGGRTETYQAAWRDGTTRSDHQFTVTEV